MALSFLSAAALLSLTSSVAAVELEEIRLHSGIGNSRLTSRGLVKRDLSVFDLHDQETFLWGAEDGLEATLGNLTIQMPNNNEHILSMEKFDGMLTAVECSEKHISMTFEDAESFSYAQRVWDWVNGEDDKSFMMVAGKGDCGDNQWRIPYTVHTIEYDNEKNVARLNADAGSFTKLAHTYALKVGNVPMSRDFKLRKRDFSEEGSIDLAKDFTGEHDIRVGSVSSRLICDPCFTSGKLNMELNIETTALIPTGISFKMQPQNVAAHAKSTLSVSQVAGSLDFTRSIAQFPLGGITIPPDVLTIGPTLDISVGAALTLSGTITLASTANASLPDSAVLEANLLSPDDNTFSGWEPEVLVDDISVTATVTTSASVFLQPAVNLEATALGIGLEAGLTLQSPFVEYALSASATTGEGACAPGDNFDFALKGTPNLGFDLSFKAGRAGEESTPIDITLGDRKFPLAEPVCFGFDADGQGTPPAPEGEAPARKRLRRF